MEKGQACEKAREEYRNQLEVTNSKQTLHYTNEMPAVFDVRICTTVYICFEEMLQWQHHKPVNTVEALVGNHLGYMKKWL